LQYLFREGISLSQFLQYLITLLAPLPKFSLGLIFLLCGNSIPNFLAAFLIADPETPYLIPIASYDNMPLKLNGVISNLFNFTFLLLFLKKN
jgi:hypothetical protein